MNTRPTDRCIFEGWTMRTFERFEELALKFEANVMLLHDRFMRRMSHPNEREWVGLCLLIRDGELEVKDVQDNPVTVDTNEVIQDYADHAVAEIKNKARKKRKDA